MNTPKLLFHGKITKKNTACDLDYLIKALNERRAYMHNIPIEELLQFFGDLIGYWKKTGLSSRYQYLKNLSDFLRHENLSKRLRIALHGNYLAMDKFVDFGDPLLMLHAQPRGLIVQWLAGNVPVLGMFSILTAIITKNVCLVKASSRGYEELVSLINTLNEINTEHIQGSDITKSIAIVLIDRKDIKSHEKLSLSADMRVAWGGYEAIETVTQYKKNIYCEDIIFGPKYSYSVIDHESLLEKSKTLALNLAIDISVFDQYACSSPHTIFIQGAWEEIIQFGQELANKLEFVNKKLLPKNSIDPGKAMEIITLRSVYGMTGKVFASEGTEWTVVCAMGDGLENGCASRVIFIKSIIDLEKLRDLNNRQKQTLGVALTEKNKHKYLDNITLYGIDRCPDLGYATYYESPWDGMFIFDRLVRWISAHKAKI